MHENRLRHSILGCMKIRYLTELRAWAAYDARRGSDPKQRAISPRAGNLVDTVDGRNPAPPGMYTTLYSTISWDKLPTSTGAGFLPSTVGHVVLIPAHEANMNPQDAFWKLDNAEYAKMFSKADRYERREKTQGNHFEISQIQIPCIS